MLSRRQRYTCPRRATTDHDCIYGERNVLPVEPAFECVLAPAASAVMSIGMPTEFALQVVFKLQNLPGDRSKPAAAVFEFDATAWWNFAHRAHGIRAIDRAYGDFQRITQLGRAPRALHALRAWRCEVRARGDDIA